MEKGEKEKAQKIFKRLLKIEFGLGTECGIVIQKGQRSETVTRKRGFWRDKGDKWAERVLLVIDEVASSGSLKKRMAAEDQVRVEVLRDPTKGLKAVAHTPFWW